MKKTGFISIVLIFFAFTFFVSCEKDFTEEFIGTYKGYTEHSMEFYGIWTTYDDIIIVTKAKQRNKILIDDQKNTYQFILKEDNTFILDLESGEFVGHLYANGWFKGDNIFYYKSYMQGRQIEKFYGVKQ